MRGMYYEIGRSAAEIVQLVPKVVGRFWSDGPLATLRLMGARTRSLVRSLMEDHRRGVSTTSAVKDDELGITDRRNHWYVATDYQTFQGAMRHVPIRPGTDVFVDFGSGKGRIVILAAAFPFRRIIGVEFSGQLHKTAEQNLAAIRPSLFCQDIELVQADATRWPIPADATVLFFFNPFEGEVLAQVFDNIRHSLRAAPRPLTIVYVRPEKFFEKQIHWQEWLEKTCELPCMEGKVAIYQSRPAGSAC